MNFKVVLYISGLIIFISSCETRENTILDFDPRDLNERKITLSSICDEVTYIPLDSNAILNRIFKVIITDDAIFLNSKDAGILKYSRQGTFKGKIGMIGRGPGEYIFYLDFCTDNKTRRIYNANIGQEINVYSETGRFLRSFSLSEYGSFIENIELFNSNLFIQFALNLERSDYEWVICDTLGKIIRKQERRCPPFTTNWSGSHNYVSVLKNKLTYYNHFSDTVFSLYTDLNIGPSLIISPGEYRRAKTRLSIEQLMSTFSITRLIETNSYFFIQYFFHNPSLAIIDKQTREIFMKVSHENDQTGDMLDGIENDVDGGLSFVPNSCYMENGRDYLICLQSAFRIKKLIESDKFTNSILCDQRKKEEFETFARSLKESDNPVLMIIRLRE